jgi:hypothetical protein
MVQHQLYVLQIDEVQLKVSPRNPKCLQFDIDEIERVGTQILTLQEMLLVFVVGPLGFEPRTKWRYHPRNPHFF